MKIELKIAVPMLLLLILMLGSQIYTFQTVSGQRSAIYDTALRAIEETRIVTELKYSVATTTINYDELLYIDSTAGDAEVKKLLAKKEALAEQRFEALRKANKAINLSARDKLLSNEEITLVDKIDTVFIQYENKNEELIKMVNDLNFGQNTTAQTAIAEKYETELMPIKDSLLVLIDRYIDARNSDIDKVKERIDYVESKGLEVMLYVLLGSFLIMLAFMFYIRYAFTLPLGELNKKVQEVANGNLDQPFRYRKRNDEIGELEKSFSSMALNLRGFILTKIETTKEEPIKNDKPAKRKQ